MQNLPEKKQFSISIEIHPRFFREVHTCITHTLFMSRIVRVTQQSEQLSLYVMPQLGVHYVRSESFLDHYLKAIENSFFGDLNQNTRKYVVENSIQVISKKWWNTETKYHPFEEWQLHYNFNENIGDAESKYSVQKALQDIVELCMRYPVPSDANCTSQVIIK